MARGFSRLLFPRFGVGEVRFEPEVKGHVKEGPDFGGMNLPRPGHVMILPAGAGSGAER